MRFLVIVGQGFKPLRLGVLDHAQGELDIALGVLVARLRSVRLNTYAFGVYTHEYFGIVRKRSKSLVERGVHLLWCSLEESSTSYTISASPRRSFST